MPIYREMVEWMMTYHTMEYYSAIKESELEVYQLTWKHFQWMMTYYTMEYYSAIKESELEVYQLTWKHFP